MSWPVSCLGDVSEFIRNGASIPQSKDAGGVPITRIESISERVFNQNKCGYAGVGDSEYLEYRLRLGDILVSHINSEKHLAKCVIFEDEGFDVIHGMNLLCARPDKQKIFPRFLFHYLSSPKFLHLIPAITKKSVNQASFTVTAFKELPIPLPPLPEQKRIAAILDKADAIRRKRQQAIQLADDFLRAVFLDMFGDPNSNPKSVDVLPMTEVFDIKTGKLNSNAAIEGGKYPFFTCAKEVFAIDEYAFDQEALLLAGNNAQADYDVKHYKGRFNAYQRTYVLTLRDSTWSYPFYKFALQYQLSNLKYASKGSSTKYITMEIMGRTMLPVPGQEDQKRFVDHFERMGNVQAALLVQAQNDESLFSALSNRAFSGQL